MVVPASDITASRPGVVVALHVIRGRRERVGDPRVDYQHRPAVGEYRPHRAVQAVPIGPGEIAGVIMVSPRNSAAPKRPSAASVLAERRPRAPPYRRSSVMSAMMLPPPSLSARITSVT